MPTQTLDTSFNNARIPLPPVVVAAEYFDYDDGTSLIGKLTPVGGLAWSKLVVGTPADADIKIKDNAGGPTYATSAANRVFAVVDLGRADGKTSAQMVGGVVGATLPFRIADGNNNLYVTWINPGIWALYQRTTAGGGALIQSSTIAPTPSDLIEVFHYGQSIGVKINGTLAISTSNVAANLTATKGGVGGGVAGPLTVPVNLWDSWKFEYDQ